MYKIKCLPADFQVKETITLDAKNNGFYSYFNLKKECLGTVEALEMISDKLKIPMKNIGFAGNKDKIAITEQKISIYMGRKDFENVKIRNISLSYIGNGQKPISLGDSDGNEFTVKLRNLGKNEVNKIRKLENKKIRCPSLFGPQRFSKNNAEVGKYIVRKEFKKAVELILIGTGKNEGMIEGFLSKKKNNFIGALRVIPLKTRKIYVHAYQSLMFNKIVMRFLQENKKFKKNIDVPLIGFDFDLGKIKNKKLREISKKTMDKEKLQPRDFVISQMPELTSEGTMRNLFFDFRYRILEIAKDELNGSKEKAVVNFTLPKSCYATVAISCLFS